MQGTECSLVGPRNRLWDRVRGKEWSGMGWLKEAISQMLKIWGFYFENSDQPLKDFKRDTWLDFYSKMKVYWPEFGDWIVKVVWEGLKQKSIRRNTATWMTGTTLANHIPLKASYLCKPLVPVLPKFQFISFSSNLGNYPYHCDIYKCMDIPYNKLARASFCCLQLKNPNWFE